jgi:hypothetical membrane protein
MPDTAGRDHWTMSAAMAWLVAAAGYLALEAVAACGTWPHYSYTRDYISDLGIPSASPWAYLMNTAFGLQGTLFLLGAILVVTAAGQPARWFVALVAANAIGNIAVAIVHSGPAAHANGTIWVHEAGAVLAIVGGNAAIVAGSAVVGSQGPRWYRTVSVGLGVPGLLSFVVLVLDMTIKAIRVPPPAVWERASVYTIIAWQLLSAAYLLTRDARSRR